MRKSLMIFSLVVLLLMVSSCFLVSKDGEVIRVLILDNGSYPAYYDGWNVNSSVNASTVLNKSYRLFIKVVTDAKLVSNPAILEKFDVMVIPDNGPSVSLVNSVVSWHNTGKGIVGVDGAACFINHGIISPGSNGKNVWWKYDYDHGTKIRTTLSHYITEGYPVDWQKSITTSVNDCAYYFLDKVNTLVGMNVLAVNPDDTSLVAAFAYDRGGGKRIAFVGPYDNFGDEALERLIIQAVIWAAGYELPPEILRVDPSATYETYELAGNQLNTH